MRSRAGLCLASVLALGGLPGACTVVVPLQGVSQRPDAGAEDVAAPQPDLRPDLPPPPPVDAEPSQGEDGAGGRMCFDQPIATQMVAPRAIIAFDRSSTMVDSRVEAVRAQLVPALSALDGAVQFGYLEFPDRTCDPVVDMCCTASDLLVPPAANSGATIGKQLACNANGRVCGTVGPRRTPTSEALRRINDYYRQQLPPGDPDLFALLITDGAPNCGGQDGQCTKTLMAADHLLRSTGAKTAILGVGIDASPSFNFCLPDVAFEGGNIFRTTTNLAPPYPWAPETDTARLKLAIDSVLAPIKARTCVIKLAGSRDRESDVSVSVAGLPLKYDPSHGDGWDFELGRSKQIRIHGPKCLQIQAGQIDPRKVDATIMCRSCGDRSLDCH
jgi:hypothetical protein